MSDGPLALALGAAANALCAALAWRANLLDPRGALAAALLGAVVAAGFGAGGWLLLASFFVLGVAVTRVGYAGKAERGLAQGQGGRRRARHVLANGAVPASAALLAAAGGGREALAVAFVAAVAEAAADTTASELGVLARSPTVLVTNLRPVPPGTDGGISLPGTAAAAAASLAVSGLAAALGLVGGAGWAIAATAGFLGTGLDSLLGALLERRGRLGNAGVNLLSSLAAALGAGLLAAL